MNGKERTAIVNELRFLSRRAVGSWPKLLEDAMAGRQIIAMRGHGETFYLVDDLVMQYMRLLHRILDAHDSWRQKFRDDDIIERFNNLIGTALSEGANIQRIGQLFDALVAQLESFATEQTVYIPLGGFEIDDNYTLQIGKVTLMQMSNTRKNELLARSVAVIERSLNSDEEKRTTRRIYEESLARIAGHACAEFRVVADEDKARELAEMETSRAIESLRVSIPSLYGIRGHVDIGFLWEISRTSQFTPVLSTDERQVAMHTAMRGPLKAYKLDQYTERALKESGLLGLAQVLERPQSEWTHFERQLLRAIHWFSDAQRQREVENVVTSLVTCWEALFTPRRKDEQSKSINSSVSAGVAATAGTTEDERNYLRERTRELYDIRSDISHGRFADMKASDRAELLVICNRVLMYLIPRLGQFRTKDELLAWVETQGGIQKDDSDELQ